MDKENMEYIRGIRDIQKYVRFIIMRNELLEILDDPFTTKDVKNRANSLLAKISFILNKC